MFLKIFKELLIEQQIVDTSPLTPLSLKLAEIPQSYQEENLTLTLCAHGDVAEGIMDNSIQSTNTLEGKDRTGNS